MDINRVELKGRVGTDLSFRKSKTGDDWISFAICVHDYNPNANVDKDKSIPTWIQVCVFNHNIVKRIKDIGLHQGMPIWIIGKLFVTQKENRGVKIPYTSVIANEFEIIKTRKDKKQETPIVPPTGNSEDEF